MRLKSIALCSTSIALVAMASSPAWGQAAQPVDPTLQAQEGPADPEAGSPQTDDAVQSAAGADEAAGEEEIVVTGLRRSLQSAQTLKRNSEQIVDAIVAEDIGKLPDVTVAETAARIPGIQVERARGEAGGFVRLRGLPDVTTTYNGREIFTAEVRNVALGDFPAGGIAAIEAFKSTTADQIEGGLGGLINVRARRPFDFSGLEISGGVRGTYATQSGKIDPNGNLLISNRWETGAGDVGALINFSYQSLRYLDSARWNGGFIGTERTTTGQEFRFPDAVGIFYGAGDRARPSINGALQWRPQPGLEFYVDGLWQGYREHFTDRALIVPLWGGAQFTNLAVRPGTNQAQSVTVRNGRRPELFRGATDRETDTFQFATGYTYDAGDIRVSTDVARTKSEFRLSVQSFDTIFTRAPTIDVNFDVPRGPGGVEFNFRDFDTTDPANFNYRGLFEQALLAAGDDWQFRTDFEWDTGMSLLPEVELGFRYSDRDASLRNGTRYSQQGFDTPLTQIPVDLEVFRPGFRGTSIQPVRTWVVPTFNSIRGNIAQLRQIAGYPEGPPPRDPAFVANEKSYAGYGQLRYEAGLGAVMVDGNLGLRVVKTEFDVTSGPPTAPVVAGDEYTDVLPHVSARLRFTDQLQMRLAATQTRTRPSFGDLGPTILGSPPGCLTDPRPPGSPAPPESCVIRGSGGNPELQPINSDNYDASLEYYFSRSGYASLALFRRDIQGFITRLNVRRDDPTFGPGRQIVNIPVNAGRGRLQGFEGAFQTFFDFLPGPFSGFGVQANLTYLDDEQTFPTGEFGLQPGEALRIPRVSKWTYNLVGMYEGGGLSARLSYNYRTRFINFYEQAQDGQFAGEYTEGVGRLDWSSSYTPFENLTIEFNVANILGAPFRDFRNFTPEGDRYPRDVRYEETIYSLGLRFRL